LSNDCLYKKEQLLNYNNILKSYKNDEYTKMETKLLNLLNNNSQIKQEPEIENVKRDEIIEKLNNIMFEIEQIKKLF